MRSQAYSMILAPIFIFLTIGMRNIIVKSVPNSRSHLKRSPYKLAIENNFHIFWFLIVANETFSLWAFGGFATTGFAFPALNMIWTIVRVLAYSSILFIDAYLWLTTRDKKAEAARVRLTLVFTELLAIICALIFAA